MESSDLDRSFAGSIPQIYEQYLVPLIFEPYAAEMAERVRSRRPHAVLEVAAGTGVVTRSLAIALPSDTSIVATDLNEPMLRHAEAIGTVRPVEWRTADAMTLPFADQSFDAVVCQFGVMFFPDRAEAFREARRVLRPGGAFVFSAWDRIEANHFADVVTRSLRPLFSDPPTFLRRVPHGYHDTGVIAADLAAAGFDSAVTISTVTAQSRADSPQAVAIAYCLGTPLRNEIESRDPTAFGKATEIATAAVAAQFGPGRVEAQVRAFVIEAVR